MLKFVLLLFFFVVGMFCENVDTMVEPINDDPIASPQRTSLFPCPRGWTHFAAQGICLFATPPLSWHDAEKYCVNLSSHLMSVHGKDSFAFAEQMVFEVDFWIGLYKFTDDKTDTWKFTNEETVNYLHWGYDGVSQCAIAAGNQMHKNHGCEELNPGICQVYAFA